MHIRRRRSRLTKRIRRKDDLDNGSTVIKEENNDENKEEDNDENKEEDNDENNED